MNMGFGLVFNAATSGVERGIGRIEGLLGDLSGTVAAVGGQMREVFEHTAGSMVKIAASLVGASADIETSESTLRFAFRDLKDSGAIDDILVKVQDTGLTTMQTTKQIADMVTDVKRMSNVNLFDPRMPEVVDQTGHKLASMANLMADVAAGSQFGMRSATRGLMSLVHGEFGSAGKHLDPIAGKMNEYKKAMTGAKTETEKFMKIAPLLARDYGGAGAAMGKTWGYVSSQLQDVKEKLMQTFGRPMMDALKGPLNQFVDYFVGQPNGILLSGNISKLDVIKEVFASIGTTVGYLASKIGSVARGIFEFVIAHPNLIKIGVTVATIVSGVAALGAAIIAVKLGVMGLAFAFSGLLTTMLPVAVMVGVLGGAVYMMARWAVGGEGVADTMERIGLILSAVWEGLTSISNGAAQLSENTAKVLDEKGLTGVTTTLLMMGYRVKRMFEGLWDGLKEAFGPGGFAHASMVYLGEQIQTLMGSVGETMGLSAHGASIDWSNAGSAIAGVVSGIVGAFGYGFGLIVKAIDFAVKAIGVLIDGLGSVKMGMNGLEKEAHPLLKVLREIKDIWDWYHDQGAYESGDQGTLSDQQSGKGQGGWQNAGQYTQWMNRKAAAMETGMMRPAAKQVADLYNPDTRTEFEKKSDAAILSGNPMAAHNESSQWLKNQDQISGTSTKALEDRLAKYHDAIMAVTTRDVYLDGDVVGKIMSKSQTHMDERTGMMGK